MKRRTHKSDEAERLREIEESHHRPLTTEIENNDASRSGIYLFTIGMFVMGVAVTLVLTSPWLSIGTIIASLFAGLLLAQLIRIAPQWERVSILRFGRFSRIAGPGPFFVIPFAEYAAMYVDHRIMADSFSAEEALTADLVPVDVDAILFWMVWDAEKACLEVENYPKAVLWSAQTAMRDAIGQINLADLSMRRKQIDHELEQALAAKCEQWGITVLSVEIRDISIPRELQHALSREAQAQKERDARIILAEVEKDISEMFVEAADVYDRNPRAMELRAMNLAYEGARDAKSVLLAPSALADGFNVGRNCGRD